MFDIKFQCFFLIRCCGLGWTVAIYGDVAFLFAYKAVKFVCRHKNSILRIVVINEERLGNFWEVIWVDEDCFLKLIICVKPVSYMPARRNVSLEVILTLLCVKNFSMYSCGIDDGETFERIIL